MIKVLFFIETLSGGGAEKVLRTLVNNMDRCRFDVTVMTLWPEEARDLLDPAVHYRALYGKASKWNRILYRLEAALGLTYRLHIRGDYDIEVAYLESGSTKIMAGSTNRHAKKAAWVHCDLKIRTPDAEALVRKSKPWYKKFDKVACVSENVRQSFVELFGDSPEAVVVYNAVDDQEIRDKTVQPAVCKKRKLTVATAGRLCDQKGYDRLLKVHRRLIEDGLDYDLWILGEGPQRLLLEQYIRDNGLSDSVKLLGFQTNPYPFFQQADLLVCSSRYEGFSTFVTEGVILKKPILTTDCTGMRELLGDSEYGMIVSNDEEGLYSGLRKMLTEKDVYEDYCQRSKLRSTAFQKNVLIAQTQEFFEELLKI